MIMNNQNLNLEQLTAMSALELEQYCEQGREYRQRLNCSVLSLVSVPEGWRVIAEESNELSGRVPVVCRFAPNGDGVTAVYLCSAGDSAPYWSVILPFDAGRACAYLHLSEQFEPVSINNVLAIVARYYLQGFWRPEKLAAALRMGGHCQ